MSKRIVTQWYSLDARVTQPGTGTWTPNASIYEQPEGLVVLVELAGVKAEEVEVHIANQKLIISGNRRDPVCAGKSGTCRVKLMEMDMGHFERIIPLPFRVEREEATALCRNGLLEVRLPRRAMGGDEVDLHQAIRLKESS